MKKKTFRTNFLKAVKDTIRHYDMLKKGDRVLVAVSGGADSVCLLRALIDIRRSAGIEIIAANLDHGLRGRESAAESRFVIDLAGKLGVHCEHTGITAHRPVKNKISVEEYLRKRRYDFLISAAKKQKCGVIATGHNMDDQAETVLMRVIKGSSTAGLGGIPPVRNERGIRVVRPLIRVARRDILLFLDAADTPHVEDSSNADTRFLRNSLRHEVIPALEKINPRIRRALVNLSDSVREDMCVLDTVKKESGERTTRSVRGRYSIGLSELLVQPKIVQKEICKELFGKAGGEMKKLTFRHWMDMERLIRSSEKGKSLDLPGKVSVTRRKNALVFSKKPKR